MAAGTDGVRERDGGVALPAAELEDAGARREGPEVDDGEAVLHLRGQTCGGFFCGLGTRFEEVGGEFSGQRWRGDCHVCLRSLWSDVFF